MKAEINQWGRLRIETENADEEKQLKDWMKKEVFYTKQEGDVISKNAFHFVERYKETYKKPLPVWIAPGKTVLARVDRFTGWVSIVLSHITKREINKETCFYYIIDEKGRDFFKFIAPPDNGFEFEGKLIDHPEQIGRGMLHDYGLSIFGISE